MNVPGFETATNLPCTQFRDDRETHYAGLKYLPPGFGAAETGDVAGIAELQSQGYPHLRP